MKKKGNDHNDRKYCNSSNNNNNHNDNHNDNNENTNNNNIYKNKNNNDNDNCNNNDVNNDDYNNNNDLSKTGRAVLMENTGKSVILGQTYFCHRPFLRGSWTNRFRTIIQCKYSWQIMNNKCSVRS